MSSKNTHLLYLAYILDKEVLHYTSLSNFKVNGDTQEAKTKINWRFQMGSLGIDPSPLILENFHILVSFKQHKPKIYKLIKL